MFHFHKVAYVYNSREVNMFSRMCKMFFLLTAVAKIIQIKRAFPELWSQMYCDVFNETLQLRKWLLAVVRYVQQSHNTTDAVTVSTSQLTPIITDQQRNDMHSASTPRTHHSVQSPHHEWVIPR